MSNVNESRNAIVKDLEFFWAKLAKPVENQFNGDMQWELQVRFPKARVAEMEQYGSVKEVKDQKGVYQLNLRKKSVKADGSDAAAIEVVGLTKGSTVDPVKIGNGSKGNVKLLLRDFEIKNPKTGKVTKTGTSVMLAKVQVTELKEYVPQARGDDFDFEGADSPAVQNNNDDF